MASQPTRMYSSLVNLLLQLRNPAILKCDAISFSDILLFINLNQLFPIPSYTHISLNALSGVSDTGKVLIRQPQRDWDIQEKIILNWISQKVFMKK
jgi:hypothetical protein